MTLGQLIFAPVGFVFFRILLNAISLFRRRGGSYCYYSFNRLWRGRGWGATPDGREYSIAGFFISMFLIALSIYA